MFLVRKITWAKWDLGRRPHLAQGEIPADAVTADLRTTNDQLSVWLSEAPHSARIEEVVLALASGMNTLDRCDLAWLNTDDVDTDGLTWIRSPGRTNVPDLANEHAHLSALDYVRLGQVATRIMQAFELGRIHRADRNRVAQILLQAERDGRLDVDSLNTRIRDELRRFRARF